jgi:hypothetical protein
VLVKTSFRSSAIGASEEVKRRKYTVANAIIEPFRPKPRETNRFVVALLMVWYFICIIGDIIYGAIVGRDQSRRDLW